MNISAQKKHFSIKKENVVLIILTGMFLITLFTSISLFYFNITKNFSETLLAKMGFDALEQEIIIGREDYIIIRGVIYEVEKKNENILLNIEVWNHVENKYLLVPVVFDRSTVENMKEEFSRDNPQQIEMYIYTTGKPDIKDFILNFLRTFSFETSVYIKEVYIEYPYDILEESLQRDKDYLSNKITGFLSEQSSPYPGFQVYDRITNSASIDKVIGMDANVSIGLDNILGVNGGGSKYSLPSNYYVEPDVLVNYPIYDISLLLGEMGDNSIQENREVWNDKEKLLKIQEKLLEIRRISLYIYYTANYMKQSSVGCSENVELCTSLISLYNYNKNLLISESLISDSYGICSVTYYLPDLLDVINDSNLKNELDLVLEGYDFLGECTVIGGGRGLCSKDLKESLYCGLLMTEGVSSRDTLRMFIIDRYSYFRGISSDELYIPDLTIKNYLSSENPINGADRSSYVISLENHINFLRILNAIKF